MSVVASAVESLRRLRAMTTDKGERLRELCAMGDLDAIKGFLVSMDPDTKLHVINSANKMNAWTALHWAAHRGHDVVVAHLLQCGADVKAVNKKGETAFDINPNLFEALNEEKSESLEEASRRNSYSSSSTLPIVPNYLRHPQLAADLGFDSGKKIKQDESLAKEKALQKLKQQGEANFPMTVLARMEGDRDFIEVDLPQESSMSFDALRAHLMAVFKIEACDDVEIRKLPNLSITRDRQVEKLMAMDELEIVAGQSLPKCMANGVKNYCSISVLVAVIAIFVLVFTSGFFQPKSVLLRVRAAGQADFVEVSVPIGHRTLSVLTVDLKSALGMSKEVRLRLLPNTLITMDEQVWRLKDGDELEIIGKP